MNSQNLSCLILSGFLLVLLAFFPNPSFAERLGLDGFRFVPAVYLEERSKDGRSCGLDKADLLADFQEILRGHGAIVFATDIVSPSTPNSERQERSKSLLAMISLTTYDDRARSLCSAYIDVDFSKLYSKIEFEVGSKRFSTLGRAYLCRGNSLTVVSTLKRSDVRLFASQVVKGCIKELSNVVR